MILYSFTCGGCPRRVEVALGTLADVPSVSSLRYCEGCAWMAESRRVSAIVARGEKAR